jgi:hypothetical protein
MKNKAAIAEVVKVRDQLVIMRERLFQLSAATAARTRRFGGEIISQGAHRPKFEITPKDVAYVRRADWSARLEQGACHAGPFVRFFA